MFPPDLTPATLTLPATDNPSIVLITGKQLRHRRFALRMQQVFGELVVGWFELDRVGASGRTPASDEKTKERKGAGWASGRVRASRIMRGGVLRSGRERLRARRKDKALRQYYAAQAATEQALFGAEVAELEASAVRRPRKIHPNDVNSPAFVQEIATLSPYFLLTLGGPLYKKPLLDAVRGVAINQHAGHSPDLRGSNTTQWALYHRQLEHVSATVHITTSGADAGPILRRSNPCLLPTDSVNAIFARVVALGTELMIETVQEIIADKTIVVYPQPPRSGKTYLSKQLPDIIEPILRDFRAGWLQKALEQQRQF
jgi:methionyl-tRNA formyltransferase